MILRKIRIMYISNENDNISIAMPNLTIITHLHKLQSKTLHIVWHISGTPPQGIFRFHGKTILFERECVQESLFSLSVWCSVWPHSGILTPKIWVFRIFLLIVKVKSWSDWRSVSRIIVLVRNSNKDGLSLTHAQSQVNEDKNAFTLYTIQWYGTMSS